MMSKIILKDHIKYRDDELILIFTGLSNGEPSQAAAFWLVIEEV
jgi:hypothetical protein